VLDECLPGMNGRPLPIVFISAHEDRDPEVPFSEDEFLGAVARAWSRRDTKV
jgi:hypothetical protein